MDFIARVFSGGVVAALLALTSAHAESLTILGSSFQPEAISNDGLVVGTALYTGFRWNANSGVQYLPLVPYPFTDLPYNPAHDVTPDGSAIVGWSFSDRYGEMARWTARGPQGLGHYPASSVHHDTTSANAVSADGRIIAGTFYSYAPSLDRRAFRWSAEDGFMGLGDLPGGGINSSATDVSFDGSVIVGWSLSSEGREAFRWTSGTGLVGLGGLSGGAFDTEGPRISGDASTIVGSSGAGVGTRAFRWTEEDGMEELGNLGEYGSVANGVSADGSIIVGTASYNAFIWTRLHGMRSLQELLANDYAFDLEGYTLVSATAISPDGRTIAGMAQYLNYGSQFAWVAVLPAPQAAVQLVLAMGLLFGIRHRLLG